MSDSKKTTKKTAAKDESTEKDDVRISLRLHKTAHPQLLAEIESYPSRFRSERIRALIEKGLRYEQQVHLLEGRSIPQVEPGSVSEKDSNDLEKTEETSSQTQNHSFLA